MEASVDSAYHPIHDSGLIQFEQMFAKGELKGLEQPLVIRGWRSPVRGRPLLHFLHGNGFCASVYWQMLAPLVCDNDGQEAPFDCIFTDLQGHGESEAGRHFLGWNGNAALATAVIESVAAQYGDVTRYAVGHSFGGVLTTLLCSRNPTLFSRAVLLDPVLFTPWMLRLLRVQKLVMPWYRTPFSQKALKRRDHWASFSHAADSLRGRGIYKGWCEASLQDFILGALKQRDGSAEVELRCPTWLEADIFDSVPYGLWSAIKRSRTPTRILYGERSYPFVAKSARLAGKRNSHFSFHELPGGHCFMQEDPQLARDELLRALGV
ncbi:alpha/beta hydrolase [Allohahella marinimesophila]|uniref:Alpha/beta hydrolase PoxA n=1 Tax=Allohahella marinimesophila TaxID=1054972 RepID=A0ABP7NNH9_9GAMM